MHMARTSVLTFAFILYATVVCVTKAATRSALTDQLGRMLGLPLDVDIGPRAAYDVPEYMERVYNCWTANGGRSDDCMAAEGEEMSDVDTVRSFVGKSESQWYKT